MPSPIPFDEPCPCGTGELYRDCCGRTVLVKRRQKRNLIIGLVMVVAVAIPALGYLYKLDQQKREDLTLPPGSYYSEEHRHWHDADGTEIIIPGYIWSPNQQRWIKVTDNLIEELEAEESRDDAHPGSPPQSTQHDRQQGGVPEPEGIAPEGKVWSEEHGHYHDIEEEDG